MEEKVNYRYVRNKNGLPVGCVAYSYNRDTRTVQYGVSVWSGKDLFDRSLAREVAYGRMVKRPSTYTLKNASKYLGDSETLELLVHIQNSSLKEGSYYKFTRRFRNVLVDEIGSLFTRVQTEAKKSDDQPQIG